MSTADKMMGGMSLSQIEREIAVAADPDLLLHQLPLSPTVCDELGALHPPARSLLSHVLFAGSGALGVSDPFPLLLGHLVKAVRAHPLRGAGSPYDDLAALPLSRLRTLVASYLFDPAGEHATDALWQRAMGRTSRDLVGEMVSALGWSVQPSEAGLAAA